MFDRHTTLNQFNLITKFMDVINSGWRNNLISLSSDGESTMTSCRSGVITLLEKQTTNGVLRVWCPAHQIAIVMKAGLSMVDDGLFVEGTNRWAVHLRRQVNLIDDIGSACLKLTYRWLHMGNTLDWMLSKRLRLMTHIEEKRSIDAPTKVGYIEASAIAAVTVVVNATFTKIQAKEMIISQQRNEI
uniref:Uncharacterized protein n=1 Tax=Hyaloperonospora arabidopsidis (strain Emoy2) TaxID=559515 RepID=M4C4I2_HYAAE